MTDLRKRVAIYAALLVCAACSSSEKSTTKSLEKSAEPTAASSARVEAATESVKLCEHRVPADLCTKCTPELAEVFKEKGDWCSEHGVPESHCYTCNPKLTFVASASAPKEPWCGEHGVPEAKCTKCKPQLIAKFIEAGDFCREHGLPESVCPYCHPELVTAAGHELPVFPAAGTKVKLASAELERDAGIQTIKVERRLFAKTIDVVGQVHFNQNKLAQLSARGDALVVEVKVDIGDQVRRGQSLVVLTSGGVGETQSRLSAAKARLNTARKSLAREQALLDRGVSSKRDVEQAQSEAAAADGEYESARASLRAAGASEESSGGTYSLTAPFDGTVVTRTAVAGKSVSAEAMLVEVADLSTMWALLEIPEDLAASVRPGQKAILKFDGLGGEIREGTVHRLSAAVDPQTRTVSARVDLPNADRTLRSGLFVRAKIEVASPRQAVLVPRDCVQRAENRTLVFMRKGPGQYEPLAVELGARADAEIEVVSGLEPGTEIVTAGAFMLKTEILKDSIGAGCTDD